MGDITAAGAALATPAEKDRPAPRQRIPLLVWFGIVWIAFIIKIGRAHV